VTSNTVNMLFDNIPNFEKINEAIIRKHNIVTMMKETSEYQTIHKEVNNEVQDTAVCTSD
jgi:uncharacterized protein YerC